MWAEMPIFLNFARSMGNLEIRSQVRVSNRLAQKDAPAARKPRKQKPPGQSRAA
jgi:hypothetical protein